MGISANNIDASGIPEGMHKSYSEHISKLSEYNGNQIKNVDHIKFKSDEDGQMGSVKFRPNGSVEAINFGNKSEANSDFLSKVDSDKTHLRTLTHEMAHVITGRNSDVVKRNADPNQRSFWREARSLSYEYHESLKSGSRENYLGKYASSNMEEFVAESFTEYKLSSNPSKYAKLVGQSIDKHYKRK